MATVATLVPPPYGWVSENVEIIRRSTFIMKLRVYQTAAEAEEQCVLSEWRIIIVLWRHPASTVDAAAETVGQCICTVVDTIRRTVHVYWPTSRLLRRQAPSPRPPSLPGQLTKWPQLQPVSLAAVRSTPSTVFDRSPASLLTRHGANDFLASALSLGCICPIANTSSYSHPAPQLVVYKSTSNQSTWSSCYTKLTAYHIHITNASDNLVHFYTSLNQRN